MSIQDSPRQIALTSEQLQGIKAKHADMTATMAAPADIPEVPKVEEVVAEFTPTATPEPMPMPEAAPVVTPEPAVAPTPEATPDNIFDQNIFAPIDNTPAAPEPVVPEPAPEVAPVTDVPSEPEDEMPSMEPPKPRTNEEIAAELEDLSRRIIDMYVELDRLVNELSQKKELNNLEPKIEPAEAVPGNTFSM